MSTTLAVHKAVIPVGGLGTRLLPVTKVLPKELLPVGRRPVIQYVVEEMRAARLQRICLVTGRKKTLIQEHFDHDPELVRRLQNLGRDELLAELAYLESGLHLTYIRQSGALLRRMIDRHIANGAAATIAVEAVPDGRLRHYGIVQPAISVGDQDEVFPISDLIERPEPDQAPSNWAIAARYVFTPSIFSAIHRTRPGWEGETQLIDAIRILLRQGGIVQAVRLSPKQRRHDVGSFDGYFRTFLDFALMDPYFGDEVRSYLEEACAQEAD